MVTTKYFTILSILLLSTTLTAGKHHKKKHGSGFFGFPDLSNILKFAFKNFGNEYEEDHYDDDDDFDCDHISGYGGKGKGKHRFHKDKKVIYKPYFLTNDYSGGHSGYNYNPPPAYYASSYSTYIPLQQPEQHFANPASHSHLTPTNFEQLDNYNPHQSLYLR